MSGVTAVSFLDDAELGVAFVSQVGVISINVSVLRQRNGIGRANISFLLLDAREQNIQRQKAGCGGRLRTNNLAADGAGSNLDLRIIANAFAFP